MEEGTKQTYAKLDEVLQGNEIKKDMAHNNKTAKPVVKYHFIRYGTNETPILSVLSFSHSTKSGQGQTQNTSTITKKVSINSQSMNFTPLPQFAQDARSEKI